MNPYDPMSHNQMNQYGMPGAPMNTNPYILESQRLSQGGGNPQAYMQNIGDQMQSQMSAAQNLAGVQGAIGKSAGGSAGEKSQITPQARADALRSMGNTAGDYANQANTASGNKYGTDFGSEQSRMLAMQEAGIY